MHAKDGNQHGEGQRCARGTNQQADDQCQAAQKLGAACQKGHEVTRAQTDGVHPLPGAFQAVAAEPAEQLLGAVSHEDDANGNTQWEFGTPNGSTGPIEGADGSANAWCTGLGDYFSDSDISLRSPAIDLTGVSGAELSFAAFRDADGFGDTAVVRFLRAVDNVQLGVDVAIDMSVFDTDYLTITIPVAAGALGETILVEWNFVSDGSVDSFSGLSIDDVRVIAAAP